MIGLEQVRRALAARGLIKLIADARSGRLLGAHILALEGADSIQTVCSRSGRASPSTTSRTRSFHISHTVEGLKLAALGR